MVTFDTSPQEYRHWGLEIDGKVAVLTLDVDEDGGLEEGYSLKLNSYDLGVDIELYDAVQRLRFEHPEVGAVVVTSGKAGVFCAGANIKMLGQASHAAKVNFCKFTNETRNAIEEATEHSGQAWLAGLNGAASGGGYELALATDHILLIDDGSSAVSLPEVPVLGVLPGTGGLTRLTDKRKVRRDLADAVATVAEGVRGQRAVEWGLVDEVVPRSRFDQAVRERALEMAARTDRPPDATGIALTPLEREGAEDHLAYPHLRVDLDPAAGTATFLLNGPEGDQPKDPAAIAEAGASYWPLALARELDDAILLLRANRPDLGCFVFRSSGDPAAVADVDAVLLEHAKDWLVREIVLMWKRTLKRVDLTSRSLVTLVEPGSCYAGTLAELVWAADRSFMLDTEPGPSLLLNGMNFGPLPMSNGLTRLGTRFLGDPERAASLEAALGQELHAPAALELGLVTFAPDELDWADEVRLALEERAAFSPDALSAMEANLRFAGPETMETKIFGRLSAWQNWVFQRPNAAGETGALRRYGTGLRPDLDHRRV